MPDRRDVHDRDVGNRVREAPDDDEPMIIRYESNIPTNPGYNVIRRIRTKDPRTWRLSADFDF